MSTEYGITEDTLRDEVHHIVYSSDLRKITQRSVFERVCDKYGIPMTGFKPFIYERAVEEARVRIQSSPELQRQQQMSNPKYFYHGDINTQQQRKYYNTIYNTPNAYHLSSVSNASSTNSKRKKKQPMLNYQDIKKHYIGTNNKSHRRRIIHRESSSEEDDDLNLDQPPSKKRKYNLSSLSPKRTAQSTREEDKHNIYEFSEPFKQMMGKQKGTWTECWEWITNYATQNDLRIGNRKIRCDDVLKKAFQREETSVSGISRLIWKHLIGAVELDENGNFKKLVYRKRKPKHDKQEDDTNTDDDDDDDNKTDEETEDESQSYHGAVISTPSIMSNIYSINKTEEAPRQKRRYRKRLRDENGNIIKKRKKSGLTRLCWMSDELKAIVGREGPLARNKITKGFWDYTEVHGLKKKGRIIVCDDKLKKIWGENTEQIHMYSVQKGLKEHITTMDKDREKEYREENPHLFEDEQEDKNSIKDDDDAKDNEIGVETYTKTESQ